MRKLITNLLDSAPTSIRKRLYLHAAIIGMFLLTMIFVSIWTGNTLTSITAIARFERTHTVSRLAAKTALLEYLDTRKNQDKELFHKNMAITQSYNKVFSRLLTMRTSISKKEYVQTLEDTFIEADHQTAEIIVNRIYVLYWHPLIKELVGYARKANPIGETILELANLAMVTDNKEQQKALLQKMRNAEIDFASYEMLFSKRCSDLANEISTLVDYFYIGLLILSVGFTGFITYLLISTFMQQAFNHARDLEKSQEQLNLIIKGSNDAPWDWDLITNAFYYSPQWWAQLGYNPDEMPADAALWERLMHPDDSEHVNSVFRGALDSVIDCYEVEFRLQHKEGHYVPVLSRGFITRDEEDNPIRVTGSNMDLTERKQAEEALRESETRFRELAELLPETVFEVDSAGKLTFVNQKAFEQFRYSQADFDRGVNALDMIVPEDRQRALENISKIFEGKNIGLSEYQALRKDGTSFPAFFHSSVIFREGEPAGLRGFIIDLSEKKQLEIQLVQAQKMESIGKLAGGVAHDFNNMLGVILGHTELALLQADENHDLYSDLKEIQTAAKRSADITKQLLAFARKQTISPRPLDLNNTVESMLNMLRRLIGEDIDLVWKPSAHIWPVKMDPTQIDQILANLCVNAQDAISGVGKLTIETGIKTFDEAYCTENPGFIPGDFVLLAVSDNGCGMDKDTLDNLFEPFFTTKEVGKGTGLGLATVYGIVKQNNGFINVYSEPGQDSIFKIYLPRLVGDEETEKAVPKKKESAGGTETILLVEDEPSILRMTRMMLERKGYTVLTATTPTEAMKKAKNQSGSIDLLMTDVIMPEMNGRDLAVKLIELHPNIKLLFMSGYTADVIAHQGILDDGVAFIQKPFSIADMTEKLREVLDEAKNPAQGPLSASQGFTTRKKNGYH